MQRKEHKWRRVTAAPKLPRGQYQVDGLSYLDSQANELCVQATGNEFTITYRYASEELSERCKHISDLHVYKGNIVSTTYSFGYEHTYNYSLKLGPTTNVTNAARLLAYINEFNSLDSIIDDVNAFCRNTNIIHADDSMDIRELKETVAKQAKEIKKLRAELADVKSEIQNSRTRNRNDSNHTELRMFK